MKQTRQKTMILEAVMNRSDHPTAEQIHQELQQVDSHLSLATVYRNLNSFVMKGKIRRIELSNMKDRYDGRMTPHDHALCTSCGRVVDVEMRYSKRKTILLDDEFKVHSVEHLYKGICRECQHKQ